MGTYTTNYNLFMPTVGEQGWGDLVNNNFSTIDTTMADLNTRVGTLETDTTALDGRVTTNEEKITTLENTIPQEGVGDFSSVNATTFYYMGNLSIESSAGPLIGTIPAQSTATVNGSRLRSGIYLNEMVYPKYYGCINIEKAKVIGQLYLQLTVNIVPVSGTSTTVSILKNGEEVTTLTINGTGGNTASNTVSVPTEYSDTSIWGAKYKYGDIYDIESYYRLSVSSVNIYMSED